MSEQPTEPQPQWGPQRVFQPPTPQAPPPKQRRSTGCLIAIGVVIVAAVLFALAIGAAILASVPDPDVVTTTGPRADSTISKGLGTQDATRDVRIVKIAPGTLGETNVRMEIVNRSSGVSDYYIEVAFEDASGTNIGFGNAVASKIRPGQKAVVIATTFEKPVARATITEVQRTASN